MDFIFSLIGLLVTFPIMILVLIIGYFDTGSPVFIQQRVGKDMKPFNLYKFRTMSPETKSVASHLAASSSITKFGAFLRKTKLDELPQLVNVLQGKMSIVGPRPNLFNQDELIKERNFCGVYDAKPGITGLAQINNIDMSTPAMLAKVDKEMIETLTISKYFVYILKTVLGGGRGDAIK
jgi:lipopolysaccharide/colanic/teichoic acid biosynthesis glycosyltransferase